MATTFLNTWKRRTNELKVEAYTIYLAFRDRRVPWYAKMLIACVLGYAFSPIDKLLNSIPIIGYLDHLVLVPLGVVLAFKKMIPPAVLGECRQMAMNRLKPDWMDAAMIVSIWCLLMSLLIISTIWVMRDWNLLTGQWFRWSIRMIFRTSVRTRGLTPSL